MKPISRGTMLAFLLAVVFDAVLWYQVYAGVPEQDAQLYFLDVGQGDSELLILPGNVKILTDAGPDQAVTRALEKILPPEDRYIDIAVITHPQLDHYGGLNDLVRRYKFGMVLWNGRDADPGSDAPWKALVKAIDENDIPKMVVRRGDMIRHRSSTISILNPDATTVQSGELNDTGIVERVRSGGLNALLTADIGFLVEDRLRNASDLQSDVLKVPHHGSKYSSSDAFLAAVSPRVAGIEVGTNNRYGHPSADALRRLSEAGANVFRTDRSGTIRIIAENGILKVFTEK